MSMPAGRSEKRTPIKLAIVISRVNQRSYKGKHFYGEYEFSGLARYHKEDLAAWGQIAG